ncbi:putative Late nodulin [Medicago truncatula]|uniref:Nodule Cysteine-Rich (NCR) secreted peptide n=1 Tax=Medicago truncatula TaxID=3880 RepID=A7KH64_MEDTR|nr:nodule-specific cysteine-rich peptide 12 [Medicago truncatula]AES62012.1 Nodule Cysteine-Rich (NCR) secreted peptide [Medicago truncatula]AFK34611.1 unknown [Medicago truncatula]RHN81380.1 putative Late nodulin [Medicago truncatula]
MAQFLMFIYVLIIFLYLFYVEAAMFELTKSTIRCVTDADCPNVVKPLKPKCVDGFCEYT